MVFYSHPNLTKLCYKMSVTTYSLCFALEEKNALAVFLLSVSLQWASFIYIPNDLGGHQLSTRKLDKVLLL